MSATWHRDLFSPISLVLFAVPVGEIMVVYHRLLPGLSPRDSMPIGSSEQTMCNGRRQCAKETSAKNKVTFCVCEKGSHNILVPNAVIAFEQVRLLPALRNSSLCSQPRLLGVLPAEPHHIYRRAQHDPDLERKQNLGCNRVPGGRRDGTEEPRREDRAEAGCTEHQRDRGGSPDERGGVVRDPCAERWRPGEASRNEEEERAVSNMSGSGSYGHR